MKHCSINGCPGTYENKNISHMIKHGGQTIIIEKVPADVCRVCGDILLALDTIEAIDRILENPGNPDHTAPVYEMPGKAITA